MEKSMESSGNNSQGIFYGWIIVGVALVSMAFWLGIRTSFSVFFVAFLGEFHWSRASTAGVQSLALITYTVLAPIVGGLIDRHGPRRVIVPGILVFALGLGMCSLIKTLPQFYLLYGVIMGSGITCVGIVSYSAVLAHWFEKRRGLASGIAVSGMGLGTFALVPLSQALISRRGWRAAFVVLGGLVMLILLPLNAIFMRHKPADVGQFMDGEKTVRVRIRRGAARNHSPEEPDEWSFGSVLVSGRFWALMGFTFFSTISIYGILVHGIEFFVDQGIERMKAAFVLALVGVVSSVFRIVWGGVSDRAGRELTFTFGLLCASLSVVSLLLIEETGKRDFVYCFLILFGMGWGVTAPMFMVVSADLFNGPIFGFIYGLVEAGIGIAGAIGSWMAGAIYDRTQSYQWAFILFIVFFSVSAALIWLAAPRKVRPDLGLEPLLGPLSSSID
jgi:MFS family permease